MDRVIRRHWRPRANLPEPAQVAELARELSTPPLVAGLLLAKGLSGASAGAFLNGRLADLPDPLLLPDMTKAATRVAAAVQSGELLAVHGDYDVDGITGATLSCDRVEVILNDTLGRLLAEKKP